MHPLSGAPMLSHAVRAIRAMLVRLSGLQMQQTCRSSRHVCCLAGADPADPAGLAIGGKAAAAPLREEAALV
jgi:hypothetical protein